MVESEIGIDIQLYNSFNVCYHNQILDLILG